MDIEPFVLVTEKMEVYVNLRLEKHGPDEKVNGYDIKLSGSFANHAILPKLDRELLPALYTDDKQRELDEFKKKLRFPRAMGKPLPWNLEVPRVVLQLHDANDATHDLIISDCTAHKFSFLPKELGIVDLDFTVKTKDLTEAQVMHLLRGNGQELKISLECKPAEEKPDNFKQAELITQEPMSDARKEAEAAFKGSAVPAIDEAAGLPTLEASAPPADNVVDIKDSAKPKKEKAAKAAPEQKPDDAPLAEKQATAPRARRGSGKAVIAPE